MFLYLVFPVSNIRASIESSLGKCYCACIKVSKRGELYFIFTWSSSPIFLIFLSITSQIHHEATPWSSSSASPRGDVVMHFLRFLSWCRRRTKPSWAWSGFFYHHQVGRWWQWFGLHVPAYTWSVFSHFMSPPLYKPNCFPFSIDTQAWSDSLFVSYVYSLQEWIFTARSCVVSPS